MNRADPLLALNEPLEQLGFRKRGGNIYTLDLGDEVLGWIGLNRAAAPTPGQTLVNPVIGVRHQGVERVVAQLLEKKFHQHVPPTISCPLGYLPPEPKSAAWTMGEGATPEVVDDLVAQIETRALPWIHAHRSLPELQQALRDGLSLQPHYRLPVVLAMSGARSQATEAVRARVEALETRTDGAAEQFLRFANAFDQWQADLV